MRVWVWFATGLAGLVLQFIPVELTASPPVDRDQLRKRQILNIFISLEKGLFGEREVHEAEQLLHRAGEYDQPWLEMALAQYQRTMVKDPVAGLRELAPGLLGEAAGKTWVKALKTAEQKRTTDWRQACLDASRRHLPEPPEPTGLALDFPTVSTFQVSDTNVQLALEAARCLLDLGKVQEPLLIIDTFGKRFEGRDGMVLAYECLGDLQLRLGYFEKAIESYEAGLKTLAALKPTEGFSEWQRVIRQRLESRLTVARRTWDDDRYGSGFVLYRAAEQQRRVEHDYVYAILLYEQLIREHPKTMYHEAAWAYRIDARLHLARDREPPQPTVARIERMRREINESEEVLKLAKRSKVPPARLAEIEAQLAARRADLAAMSAVPLGTKSATLARDEAKSFLSGNEWGLYRGEVLVLLANYMLDAEMDLQAAGKYYQRAAEWFDGVKKIDSTIELYAMPEKVRQVAGPPQAEREQDFWSNISSAEVKAGQLFNRRTCPWYWAHFRKAIVLRTGFIHFVERDFDKAKTEWLKLYDLDPFYKEEEGRRFGSTVQRLIWDIDHNDGCLRATPPEMAQFRDKKLRLAVLLADLAYEDMAHKEAKARYDAILRGDYGKLGKGQAAYISFVLALCYDWLDDRTTCMKILDKFGQEFANTPTEPAALVCRGNLLTQNPKEVFPALVARGRADYERVIERFPGTVYAENALFYLADDYCCRQEYEEAKELLLAYLKKYPKGRWTGAALEDLESIERAVKKAGKESENE